MTSRIAPYVCAAFLLAGAGCKSSQPSASANNSMSASTADSGGSAIPQVGGSSQVSPADADGIRAAIENHLRGNHNLNVGAMEMTVDSIAINGDQAQAHTSFRMKNNGSTGMTMQYFLQRSGSGWVVTNGQPADGNTTLPPSTSAPSANSGQASQGALPDVDAFLKDHPASKSN
jgi:hypothetical protein